MSRRDLQALRAREAELKAEGQAILAAADAENRDLTDDEAEDCDAIEAKIEANAAEIKVAEKRARREKVFAAGMLAATAITPVAGAAASIISNEPDPARTYGFHSLAEFGQAVRSAVMPGGQVDPRLMQAAPTNFHQETGSTDGEGYQVPPDFREGIAQLVFAEDEFNLLNEIDVEPTESNVVQLLADETTPWGSTGVQAKWRSEGTQMTATKLDTEARQIPLHQLYAFVTATDELLEDTSRLNARLTTKSTQAIRWKLADAIHWGTGAGQPLGWMNAGCLVTVAKESGQAAATIVPENIAKMWSRMTPAGLSRARWYINSDVMPQLMTMTISGNPIWTPPASGFVGAPGGFLLGRPIIPVEHAETLGTLGDVQFVDPMGYYGASKTSGLQFAQSMHLFFDYGIEAFRWTIRFGGQPHLQAAISPKRGSATKSHFVALATRA